jgi:2-keto-4-pentenoate hydratase
MAFVSPLPPTALLEVAERQLADFRRGAPGTVFADPTTQLSIEDAYAVQRLVARLRVADGEAPAGYKVGCAGEHVQAQFGTRGPVSGHLWRDELRQSGGWVSANRFRNLAVEAEVAALLDDDGRVAATFPVVELHDYVFRGEPPTPAELLIDGEVVDSGSPFAMDGGAQASLDWLRGHLGELGAVLPPRSLVLLGGPLHIVPVAAGARVTARVAGMHAEVSISG